MLSELDNFYLQKEEPVKSCLAVLRQMILKQDKKIAAAWKYGMPFSAIREKCFVICGCIKNYISLIPVSLKENI